MPSYHYPGNGESALKLCITLASTLGKTKISFLHATRRLLFSHLLFFDKFHQHFT
jgi:hypothetical protein